MAFGLPSLSNLASSIGNAVGAAAGKAADAVTQQKPATTTPPATTTAPAAPKLGDVFESAPSKPVVCGGNSTAGAQCLPDWGKTSGGGGSGAGINPSGR